MGAKKKAKPAAGAKWGVYDVFFALWFVSEEKLDGKPFVRSNEWTKLPKGAWKGTEAEAKELAERIKKGPRQFGGMGEQCVAQPIPS